MLCACKRLCLAVTSFLCIQVLMYAFVCLYFYIGPCTGGTRCPGSSRGEVGCTKTECGYEPS